MPKQLLIYDTPVALSAEKHRDVSVDASAGYSFSAGVNAAPLMTVEMLHAAAEYAIVFAGSGDDIVPVTVLGMRNAQNLFLSPASEWSAEYIPAFLRCYPFVFAASADHKTVTLCIDESHVGVNRENRGQRLFDDDGQPSAYTQGMLKFLQEYRHQFQRSKLFCQRLAAHGLLEPMRAEISTPDGEKTSLANFLAVSRTRVRELGAEALADLARTDELELLYLHLYSMRNFKDIKARLMNSKTQPVPEVAATT
jgi:hypothetical protein